METRELEGQLLSVEFANKDYMVYLKGKRPTEGNLKEGLLKMFEGYGDVTIGEIQYNGADKDFFTSARMSTEEKAVSFIKFFASNKDNFPLVEIVCGNLQKKDVLKKFKADQKDNLYCTITPVKADIDIEQVKQQVKQMFPNLRSLTKAERDGATSVTFIFGNTGELYNFIM